MGGEPEVNVSERSILLMSPTPSKEDGQDLRNMQYLSEQDIVHSGMKLQEAVTSKNSKQRRKVQKAKRVRL